MSEVAITEREIVTTDWDETTPDALQHLYPRDPRYRKSRATSPQPGDVAKCGWTKKPGSGGYDSHAPMCRICDALRNRASDV